MSQIKTIKDVDLKGKKVFVRVDFNVPFDNKGEISDDTRIVAALPTIKYLIDEGAMLVLTSHLGRPKSKEDKQFSLAPVAKALSEKLGKPVVFVDDCIGPKVKEACAAMKPGDVVLLENSRFYPEEKKNDPEFAKKLAEDTGAEAYVNDAFGTAHRAHATTAGVAAYLPIKVAGLLIEKELEFLGSKTENPERHCNSRRSESFRQDYCHRFPPRQVRFNAHRRRYGLHFCARAGKESRKEPR